MRVLLNPARRRSRPGGKDVAFPFQKELDPDGLAFNSQNARYHFPKRDYVPFRSVFLQADILLYSRLVVIDRFQYGRGNPVRFVDSLGLQVSDYGEDLPASRGANKNFTDPPDPNAGIRAGRPTAETIEAFEKAIEILKTSECIDLAVRRMASAEMLQQSLSKCDSVRIIAHASKDAPYFALYDTHKPGTPEIDWTKNSKPSCFIASCHGGDIAQDINKQSGETITARSMTTGEALRDEIVKSATKELEEYPERVKGCCKKLTLCMLIGPAGIIVWDK